MWSFIIATYFVETNGQVYFAGHYFNLITYLCCCLHFFPGKNSTPNKQWVREMELEDGILEENWNSVSYFLEKEVLLSHPSQQRFRKTNRKLPFAYGA